jgi:hypothetical protein
MWCHFATHAADMYTCLHIMGHKMRALLVEEQEACARWIDVVNLTVPSCAVQLILRITCNATGYYTPPAASRYIAARHRFADVTVIYMLRDVVI